MVNEPSVFEPLKFYCIMKVCTNTLCFISFLHDKVIMLKVLYFRRLQPAFTTKKVREKIKREPVFHDDLLETPVKKVKIFSLH